MAVRRGTKTAGSLIQKLENRILFSQFPPVTAPSDFSGSALSSTSVQLTWTDNSSNELNFLIERGLDGLSYEPIASAPRESQKFVDFTVEPSTTYYYRIRAHGKNANSAFVNLGSSVILTPSPASDFFAKIDAEGNLNVFGTNDNDLLSVAISGLNVVCTQNLVTRNFTLGDFDRINVYGLDGNDRIVIGVGVGGANLNGGNGDDTMIGSTGEDRLDGGDGDDVLRGLDGNDTLLGGRGRDTLFGGADNDLLDGGDQNDKLLGGDGDDTLLGGRGNDRLFGEEGLDSLLGGAGDNLITG